MRLRRITLQQFRNVPFADLSLEGNQQFFLGQNAQGKTNLLEAIGFITALRSFRTSENKLLIAQGQSEAAIACDLEQEKRGASRVLIRLRSSGKKVQCDGEEVTRMADYLGAFPTVVFSSQDQQLVRGSPAGRRRWIDLTLAAMNPDYLRHLQQYHRALAERNALLKRGANLAEIEAFEKPLSESAAAIVAKRIEGIRLLAAPIASAYSKIADSGEVAEMLYSPDEKGIGVGDWIARFAASRTRDLALKSTSVGPHRDDFALQLEGRAARDFASEGQQRSFVISLRLAQLSYFRDSSKIEPILLADDVLGELDPGRRERFWASLGQHRQIIATGTRLPEGDLGSWQIFEVKGGGFTPRVA